MAIVERHVLSVPIVEMLIVDQAALSLSRRLVDESVGPLAQERLDKPFCLAIGPGPVGPGKAVAHAEAPTGLGKELRAVAGAVVGE